MNTQPLTCGTWLSAEPTGQRDETGETATTTLTTTKLADGGSSSEIDGTGVLPRSPASIDPLSLDPSGPKHIGHGARRLGQGARQCAAAF